MKLTEDYLKSQGWENRPKSAYSQDELESGYVDNTLYLRYTKLKDWCHYAFIYKQDEGNEWQLNIRDCDSYKISLKKSG